MQGNSANTGLWCGIGACFGFGGTAASHVSQIPISGCVEPDISDDFDIQKDNELQSKLSAPAADAVMTKPPAAEPSKKKVKSDKDELAKEIEKVSEQIAINDAENAIQQKPYVFPAVDLLKAPDRVKPVIRRLICVRRRQSLNRLLMYLG